jgi:dihydroorotase
MNYQITSLFKSIVHHNISMELLLKSVKVVDSRSPFNGQIVDILIKNNQIKQVGSNISVDSAEIFEVEGACVSIGWCDIGTQTGDPGFEHKEDLKTVAKAAAHGGFTHLGTASTTNPVSHSKSEILYTIHNTHSELVDFHPIGALTHDNNGKDISEFHEMNEVGAVGFSDSFHAVQHSGVLLRTLLYAKSFAGTVYNQPLDEQIAAGGYVHESEHSIRYGMKGIPSLAESMMVQRDLYLLEYTDSKLHLSNISTKESVDLIREAKAKGLNVTASVNPMNLYFTNDILDNFDTNYRVNPPIREKSDQLALIEGLKDGTIDCIVSNHRPQDLESKRLELMYADDGVIMLETAFSVSLAATADKLTLEDLIEKITHQPRTILGINAVHINENEIADLTIFHPSTEWTYSKSAIQSKSKNSPFIDKALKGKVLGVVNNGQFLKF